MALSAFNYEASKGTLAPAFGTESSFQCRVSTTESAALVAGQAVKLVDTAGADIIVTAVTAAGDSVFGFVPYGYTKEEYAAGDTIKISTQGNTMLLEASAAVARGASVEVVPTGAKVATASSGTVVGVALDKAAADGDLIRVAITSIGL